MNINRVPCKNCYCDECKEDIRKGKLNIHSKACLCIRCENIRCKQTIQHIKTNPKRLLMTLINKFKQLGPKYLGELGLTTFDLKTFRAIDDVLIGTYLLLHSMNFIHHHHVATLPVWSDVVLRSCSKKVQLFFQNEGDIDTILSGLVYFLVEKDGVTYFQNYQANLNAQIAQATQNIQATLGAQITKATQNVKDAKDALFAQVTEDVQDSIITQATQNVQDAQDVLIAQLTQAIKITETVLNIQNFDFDSDYDYSSDDDF